jgi:hypothetical protein
MRVNWQDPGSSRAGAADQTTVEITGFAAMVLATARPRISF